MTLEADNLLLNQLIRSPRLPFYAQRIDAVLEQEAQRRQAFYDQIKEGEKVEFINGEVIVHSPVKLRHTTANKRLLVLLDTHVQRHDLGFVGMEKMMISLTRNDYEPDICFFDRAKADQFTPDQMRFPAPDFIVEVLSESTQANDRGVKFDDYAAHGVTEYWIIDPKTETAEQVRLQGESYALIVKAKTGLLENFAVPHFTIPVRAIFDPQENQRALAQILSK
jgi:Uma2 family endonuclease